LIAIVVQVKDKDGTILVMQPPTNKNEFKLVEVMRIKSGVIGFT
jgi:hypothetical protein